MIRRNFIAGMIALLLLVPGLVFAQYPNVRVSAIGSTDPEEVTISINPVNPSNLAAGANINYYYYSFDGGLSWTEGQLSSSYGVWGDPCVIFDGAGKLYFSHLSNPPFGSWLDRLVVQKSVNGGMTWSDGVGVGHNPPKDQDKEWMASDMTGSAFDGNLYMAWTEFDAIGSSNPNDSTRILFSRSTDSSLTWSTPVKVSDVSGGCLDNDFTIEGAVPAVGPNGEVYTSWASAEGIFFDKSTDGGVTFGSDVFVTSQPGGWAFDVPGIYRCNGFPVTACDVSSSPYQGNVYVMWSDQRNGTSDTDVFFIKSTDGGSSWGSTVRVNDDATTRHQFFPWMSVDPITGFIYVVFYDRRDTAGNATEVYVAKSYDGGDTFTNFRVSATAFIPSASVFFGDYTNIAPRNGKVYPIWMRMDGFDLSVWMAIVDETVGIGSPEEQLAIHDLDLLRSYPNPFNPTTTISYALPSSGAASLAVYDVAGRKIRSLVDGYQDAGVHNVSWDGRSSAGTEVAAGIYFLKLESNRKSVTGKIVLAK